MICYATFNTATGAIFQTGRALDLDSVNAACPPEQVAIEVDPSISDSTHYISAGVAVVIPTSPSSSYIFDYSTKAWVDPRTLSVAQFEKRAEINASGLIANQGTFNFRQKLFQCDALGRSNIDGMNGIITLLNALPANWLGQWKASDDTFLPIPDIATWVLFYGAMVAQGQANFVHSQALKSKIALATTNQQLDEISWTTVT